MSWTEHHRPVGEHVRLGKVRRTKGAIKLHLLLDTMAICRRFAVVTKQDERDQGGAHVRFSPGTDLAIDRGYVDYEWFRELTQEEVYFVTRMKEKAVYEVKEELQLPQNSNVVSDQIICFPRLAREEKSQCVPARGDLGHRRSREVHRVPLQPAGLWGDDIAAIYKTAGRWNCF